MRWNYLIPLLVILPLLYGCAPVVPTVAATPTLASTPKGEMPLIPTNTPTTTTVPTPTITPIIIQHLIPTPKVTPTPTTETEPTFTGVNIVIVYDNNPYDRRLKTAWGFSCVVKLGVRSILFDTGGDGSILLRNMEQLGIEPKVIDTVVLSHIHGDHVGGLASFLERNNSVTVYLPDSFPRSYKDGIILSGARLEKVSEARELFTGVFTTGELDGGIKEQSLVVATTRGLVVVTGCAHPGVVKVVREAKEIGKDKIYLVLGGFHLSGASDSAIESIIENFLKLGVEKVAPCHCSGDRARKLFKKWFEQNYVEAGVGREIIVR